MFYSLRWKLLVGIIIVVALSIGALGWVANRTTRREFDRYISQDQALRYQRLALTLTAYYEETGSWEGVQNLIDKIKDTYSSDIVIVDDQEAVISTSRDLPAATGTEELGLKIATLGDANNPAGFLYLQSRSRSEIEKVFLSSVNDAIILSVVISLISSISLLFYYSKRTLTPIQRLTEAAKRIREGDLDQEVAVNSKDEVGKLASAFNAMAGELRKQERLRKNMVSDLAHELRSPLTKSHGYLKALKEGKMDPDEEVIDALYKNSEVLKRLINDLHDLARAEAGKLRMEKEPVLASDLINAALESVQVRLAEKKLNMRVDLPEGVIVNVDPGRIQQVLRNLLDNAITYSPEGEDIFIQGKDMEDRVKLSITDNGPGIPEGDLQRVFDRFYRVDQSRSRETGGTGLGLTIAREIIQAHGGQIEVESDSGEGTTFSFYLPKET